MSFYIKNSNYSLHHMFDKLGTSYSPGYWEILAGLNSHYVYVDSALDLTGNANDGVGAALGFIYSYF